MRRFSVLYVAAYIFTIFAANWSIAHVGQPTPHGGPHTIPVGFGYRAPSGVLWVGIAFTLRDLVQMASGRRTVVAAILAGAAVSYAVAPSFALASGVAFLLSEGLDFAVYTPLMESGRWLTGVAASNVAGTFVDTFLFLWLAFHSIQFWQGQVIGKLWMTVAAVIVLYPVRRRRMVAA